MAKQTTTGELNQKIVIQKKIANTNAYGGGGDVWDNYWETFAKVEPLKSSRTLEANQANMRMVVRFTVRARKDKELYDDMLVKWRGETFIIQNYIPDPTYKEFNVFDAAVANILDVMQGNG